MSNYVGDNKGSMRDPCVGYEYVGGYSSDHNCRPHKRKRPLRDSVKRKARKKERRMWKKIPESD